MVTSGAVAASAGTAPPSSAARSGGGKATGSAGAGGAALRARSRIAAITAMISSTRTRSPAKTQIWLPAMPDRTAARSSMTVLSRQRVTRTDA